MNRIKTVVKYNIASLLLIFILNFRSAALENRYPDLVVTAIQFPNGFKIGTCSDIKVAVANKGKKSNAFNVGLSCHPASTQFIKLSHLNAQSTTWITFKNVTVPTQRLVKVRATADIKRHIKESNERNNEKTRYIRPNGGCGTAPLHLPVDRRF